MTNARLVSARAVARSARSVLLLSWETSTVWVRPSAVRNVTVVPATDCTVPSSRHMGSAGGPGAFAALGMDAEGELTLEVVRPSEDASPVPMAMPASSYGRPPSTPSTATREPEVIVSAVRRWAEAMSA